MPYSRSQPLSCSRLARASNPIQIENAKTGSPAWDAYPEARNGEVEGYASAPSVNRGESISFFVSSTEPTYVLEIFRMGWYGGLGARQMLGPIARTGTRQTIPAPNPTTAIVECNWTDPYTITIPNTPDPTDWCSGVYLVLLTSGTSNQQERRRPRLRSIVRSTAAPAAATSSGTGSTTCCGSSSARDSTSRTPRISIPRAAARFF